MNTESQILPSYIKTTHTPGVHLVHAIGFGFGPPRALPSAPEKPCPTPPAPTKSVRDAWLAQDPIPPAPPKLKKYFPNSVSVNNCIIHQTGNHKIFFRLRIFEKLHIASNRQWNNNKFFCKGKYSNYCTMHYLGNHRIIVKLRIFEHQHNSLVMQS